MEKQMNKGISLIVLVITIIVMIILAGAVVLTLTNSGIISKANEATEKTNLAQMQNAATLAWSDAYLANLRGQTLIDSVDEKLRGLDENYKEKYDIEITDAGVLVELKDDNWTPLYEGEGSITTGILKVADEHVFSTINEFKITIVGQQYNGPIVATPIFVEQLYVLAVLDNNKATTFNSIMDIDTGLKQLTEDSVIVAAQHTTDSSGNKASSIVLLDKDMMPITEEYKITKIETKENANNTILFQGNLEANQEILVESADVTHKYIVISSYGEDEGLLAKSENSPYIHYFTYSDCSVKYNSDGTAVLTVRKELENVVIYDCGQNQDMVRDGNYIAKYDKNNWTLIFWDDNVKSVPQTIEGKPITAVRLSGNSIYYDREMEIFFEGFFISDPVYGNIEVAAGVNPDKIFNALKDKDTIYDVTIDVSALSNVNIPTELLAFSSEHLKIYVSPAVKVNYADYDVVQVKQ